MRFIIGCAYILSEADDLFVCKGKVVTCFSVDLVCWRERETFIQNELEVIPSGMRNHSSSSS
jgi:hypothetical protein